MSYTTFQLTDGTTTQSLIGSGAFLREGEAQLPLARIAEQELGQVGPYKELEIALGLDIDGTNAPTAAATIRTIQQLLIQARRWDDGVPGTAAVLLQASVTGGVGTLEAVILDGDLILPKSYHDINFVGEVAGATLKLRTRVWLRAVEAGVSSASTVIGSVWTLTFASSFANLSPVKLTWSAPASARGWARGPLIVAASSADIGVVEGETFAAGGDFANIVPTNTLVARGANVLRFTRPASPSSAGSTTALTYANIPTILKSGPKTVDVWATVMGGAVGDLNQLYLSYKGPADIFDRYTPVVNLPSEDGYSLAPIFVGTLDVPEGGLETLGMGMYGQTVSDIAYLDYFVFVERKPTTFVIQPTIVAAANAFGSASAVQGVWDAHQTTYPDPLIAIERTGAPFTRTHVPYQGEAWVGAQGAGMAGIWMASDGVTLRYPATAGGTTAFASTFTAARRRAYLLPE